MSYEQPLSQYSVKAITSAVNNFSGASASYGGPLLKIPEVDVNCCVTLFDNYKLAACTALSQGSCFSDKTCITWSASTIDPLPSDRSTVYSWNGSTAENDMCACSLTAAPSCAQYGWDCNASVYGDLNFSKPEIGVYPGCTVKVTALGGVGYFSSTLTSFNFRGSVSVLENYLSDCCGVTSCTGSSSISATGPSPWVFQSATGTCLTSGGKTYRSLEIGFEADVESGYNPTCCPGHTYDSYNNWCRVAPAESCGIDLITYCDEITPTECYCGYNPIRPCSDTVLDLGTGISVTYTNRSNCLALLSFDFLFIPYANSGFPTIRDNLCFEDLNLTYKIEVLSGGC